MDWSDVYANMAASNPNYQGQLPRATIDPVTSPPAISPNTPTPGFNQGSAGGGTPWSYGSSPLGAGAAMPGFGSMSVQQFANMLGIPTSDPRIAQYEQGQTPGGGALSPQQIQQMLRTQNPGSATPGNPWVMGTEAGWVPGAAQPNVPTPQPQPQMPQTIGNMASGDYNIQNPNAPAYSLNVGAYLNPEVDFLNKRAMQDLQGIYGGNMQSGPTMRAMADYINNMNTANAWNPAVATAENQQRFGYGVNAADRAFQYQAGLNDQTIPFQQQMQLAGLGFQGAQGQQNVANLLATLLGQNAIAAGSATGAGTLGQGNAINQLISNMMTQWLGQNALNNLPGLIGGGGGGGGGSGGGGG